MMVQRGADMDDNQERNEVADGTVHHEYLVREGAVRWPDRRQFKQTEHDDGRRNAEVPNQPRIGCTISSA